MTRRRSLIITIDGPSGTGKSTAAQLLARRLKYLYLDTGAMYRAVAWKALQRGISLKNKSSLARLARQSRIIFRSNFQHQTRVFLNGKDVTAAIRRPEVSQAASLVAVIPAVRKELVRQQRLLGVGGGVVAEGRDAGTVVFPRAELKIFLTASAPERARRRFEELRALRYKVTFPQILKETNQRDRRDRQRAASPLRQAKGALRIDNSNLQVEKVVDTIMDYVRERKRNL